MRNTQTINKKLLFFCILSFLVDKIERKATLKNERVLKKSLHIIMRSETTNAPIPKPMSIGVFNSENLFNSWDELNKPIKRKK